MKKILNMGFRMFLLIFLGFFGNDLTKLLRKKSQKRALNSLIGLTRCSYETVMFKG